MAPQRPIVVHYEHPDWFRPLFRELDRRGVPHERWDAARQVLDPSADPRAGGIALFFNRMSPSAWKRGRSGAITATLHLLAHVESRGVATFNGFTAFLHETSKALQISLLDRLALPAPR